MDGGCVKLSSLAVWWRKLKKQSTATLLVFLVLIDVVVRAAEDPCSKSLFLTNNKRNVTNRGRKRDGYVNDVGSVRSGAWYRFEMDGARMPETCPEVYSCGTIIPIWLDATHPTDNNTISVTAYGHEAADCEYYEYSIKVKRCLADNRRGVFYVYQLQTPDVGPSAYCAEPGEHWCSARDEWNEEKKACVPKPTQPPYFTTKPPPTFGPDEELEEATVPSETKATENGKMGSHGDVVDNRPLIIGISVAAAVLIVIILIVILVYFLSRKSRRDKNKGMRKDSDMTM